ncbi:PAS domain-containing sensor histidine kinase [Flavobacterium sp. ACAM 123]|uniref:sensor histidine kinase n=1 Tax=Flavobacterium sp. ACAM 123 TaxID=1189620 RepID=UPI00067F9677|nr:PAS domain-containing sensor histidine kinase [Flavobacterium sp. ACAM 123]
MKRTEENVINNNYDNYDSFDNFEKFFDLAPDLLCVAGYDGYLKRVNPAVSELLGYTKEELLSKPIDEFVYPDDRKSTSSARNELRKKISLFNFENRYITKSGAIVWLLWTSLPIESDKVVYAIAKNITYKKELEEERNIHLAELTKINHEFKQITYSTAHDIKSPVNNMLTVFELLDLSKITDSETLEFISILKFSTEGLKQMLSEYIAILNETNIINSHLEELNLNATLDEVLLSINSIINNSNAIINVDFSEFETISFNKGYLKSIFLNLLTNAIKYSKYDCVPIVSIYSKIVNGNKQLIISDNGIGFDMDKVKSKIFGLHQKFNDNIDSQGIGLYLVYNHITSLGGKIAVESKINEGAKFIITFKS